MALIRSLLQILAIGMTYSYNEGIQRSSHEPVKEPCAKSNTEAHNGFELHQNQVSYSHRTTAFEVSPMSYLAPLPKMPSQEDSMPPLSRADPKSVSVLLCCTTALQVRCCVYENAISIPLLAKFYESEISNLCVGDNGGRYHVLFGVDRCHHMAMQVS